MSVDRVVPAVAGTFILLSLVLSQIHHVLLLYATAFVGLNLLQSAFTGYCPLAKVLKRTGLKSGAAFG